MLSVEQRRERAATAIERAFRVMGDLRSDLQKAAGGGGGGEVPMRAVSAAGGPLQRAVTAAVERALGTGAAPKTESVSEELAKAVLADVAAITGEYDPDKLATIIETASREKVSITNVDAAVALAKATCSEPTYSFSLDSGAAIAAERAQEKVDHAEWLNKNAGGGGAIAVPKETLRMWRSDAEALAYLRDNPIQPTRIGHAAKPWVDNRAELRELRNESRRQGNHGGAEMWQRELDMAEVRANVAAGPTSVDTWGGRVELVQQP